MEYQEIINSSLSALRMNKMRTGLTMLGIIIGISSVILIASVGQGAVAFISNELSTFGSNYFQIAPGADMLGSIAGASGEALTLKDSDAIESSGIENIESVAPISFSSRVVQSAEKEKSALIYGLTEQGQTMLKPELVYGELLSESEVNSRVAILGKDVLKDLFGENVNPVGESIRIDGIRFRVIGVSKSESKLAGSFLNSSVIVPLQVLNDQIKGDDELWEIDVSVKDMNFLNQTMNDVESFLRERRGLSDGETSNFNMVSLKDSLDTINTITSMLTLLIAGISSISLVVGGVGVMNIMLVSVTERTKEIGLLKSIGAKDKDILMQFLIESVVMSLIGGSTGIFIGISGAFLISLAAKIPFILSIEWITLAVIASTLVGVVFGLYPARRAAKLSPIDALRYE